MSLARAEVAQAEATTLLALLDDCDLGELLASTRNPLLALRVEAERSAASPRSAVA
jgi:ribosomal protein L12E/L44/L45/RPP1/RPP2